MIAAQLAGVDIQETQAKTALTKAKTHATLNPPKKAPKVNQYGYTDTDWLRMTTAERRRIIAKGKTGKKPAGAKPKTAGQVFEDKYGVKPANQAAVARATTSIGQAESWMKRIRESNPDMTRAELVQTLTSGQPADKESGSPAIPALPALWVSVALDRALLNGRISHGTASKLHKAGYSVKGLGLRTTVRGPASLPASKL